MKRLTRAEAKADMKVVWAWHKEWKGWYIVNWRLDGWSFFPGDGILHEDDYFSEFRELEVPEKINA